MIMIMITTTNKEAFLDGRERARVNKIGPYAYTQVMMMMRMMINDDDDDNDYDDDHLSVTVVKVPAAASL